MLVAGAVFNSPVIWSDGCPNLLVWMLQTVGIIGATVQIQFGYDQIGFGVDMTDWRNILPAFALVPNTETPVVVAHPTRSYRLLVTAPALAGVEFDWYAAPFIG